MFLNTRVDQQQSAAGRASSSAGGLLGLGLDDHSPSATSAPINISGRGGGVGAMGMSMGGSSWTGNVGSGVGVGGGDLGLSGALTASALDQFTSHHNSLTPGSFRNSYGSEASWGGREDADVDITNELDYDPFDYDPLAYDADHHQHSPMMLLSDDPTTFQDLFLPDDGGAGGGAMLGGQTLSYLPGGAGQHFSPRGDGFNVPSPASSAGSPGVDGGGGGGGGGRHSRASSVSSQRPAIPGSPGMQVNDAFGKLAFDPVEMDVQWRKQNAPSVPASPPTFPQAPTSPGLKAQSPPSLVIPSDTTTTSNNQGLSIPVFGGVVGGPGLQAPTLGGLVPGGPSINIVPSTPVSGGGSAAGPSQPFQQLLQSLNSAHRASGGVAGNTQSGATQSHRSPALSTITLKNNLNNSLNNNNNASSSDMKQEQIDATMEDWKQQSAAGSSSRTTYNDVSFDFQPPSSTSAAGSSSFTFPSSGANPDYLGFSNVSSVRPRSRSDTSTRPNWAGLMGSSAPAGLGGHGTINPNSLSGSLIHDTSSTTSSSLLGSLHLPSTSGITTTADDMSLSGGFGLGMGGLNVPGSNIRRAKSDGGSPRHVRGSRSEDFGRSGLSDMFLLPSARPIVTPDGSLAPSDPRFATSDSLYTTAGGGVIRHGRRGSASHSRNSSSSSRVSPYPSPSGSPAHVHEALPSVLPPPFVSTGLVGNSNHPSLPAPYGMGGNGQAVSAVGTTTSVVDPATGLVANPARSQVTTPATHKASEARRKQEALFACPFPGCGSTFTRHFNLKGHIRSHNDERPFRCKWTGCGKGFARRHDCRRHESLHLNHRPYTCEGCQKTFARMDALNRHLKSEGGVECRARQSGDFEHSDGSTDGNGVNMKTEDAGGWGPSGGSAGSGAFVM